MKTPFELIKNDKDSSFRILHHKVNPDSFLWNYHYHPELEIVFVKNGIGRRHVGHHLSYYDDGDLVFIGPNIPHSGFGYGAVALHEEVVIQFSEKFLGSAIDKSPEFDKIKKLFQRSPQGICFKGNTKRKVGKMCMEIIKMEPLPRLFQLIEILQSLEESTEYEYLNPTDTSFYLDIKDQSRLKKIYEYVEEKFTSEIRTSEIAEYVHMTVPAFCNYFKKQTNMRFSDFVNQHRINYACRQIVMGKEISNIAFESGFNSLSYFSRAFKKEKGVGPLEFKKNYKDS